MYKETAEHMGEKNTHTFLLFPSQSYSTEMLKDIGNARSCEDHSI